jgi:hypothetical protein
MPLPGPKCPFNEFPWHDPDQLLDNKNKISPVRPDDEANTGQKRSFAQRCELAKPPGTKCPFNECSRHDPDRLLDNKNKLESRAGSSFT